VVSLVGHRAQNHPQQLAVNGPRDDVDDRRTPLDLLAECRALAGVAKFDLDVAASAANNKAVHYITRERDGLATPWRGRVWCNPPYSDIRPWVEKAWTEWGTGNVETIAMLLPANRTEQSWWQECVEPLRDGDPLRVHFLAGRRRFDRPGWEKPAKGDRPPFGLCLLVWRTP
jgi:phage N-6-adenine-methyltransferase